MDSTANILILVMIGGAIILGAIWALSRNRGSADAPPAKLDDSVSASPQPLDVPPPAAKVADTPPAPKPAPEPAQKPGQKAPARPAPKKSATPKTTPVKSAATPTAPVAPPEPPPLTAIGVAAAVGAPDNLLQIKGLGPKLNTLLAGLGITRFDQIAAWNAEDIAKVDERLGAFKGRIERDSWVEQAGFLAKGAVAEFEAKFGKLDSENR